MVVVTPKSTERAVELYSKIVKDKIQTTNILSSELAKTIENAYRDVNIAFGNPRLKLGNSYKNMQQFGLQKEKSHSRVYQSIYLLPVFENWVSSQV